MGLTSNNQTQNRTDMKLGLTLIWLLIIFTVQGQNHLIVEDLELERIPDKSLFYKAFRGEVDLSLSAIGVSRVNLETGAGHVNIRQSKDRVMRVEAEIVVAAKSANSAYRAIDEGLQLALTKEGEEIFFVSMFDSDNQNLDHSFDFFRAPARKVNLEIFVPSDLDIKLNDRSGELSIKEVNNNLDITDTSGGILIQDVVGDLNLIDHSGEVNIQNVNENVEGDPVINITDHSGGLSLYNLTGKTRVVDYSGGLFIDYLVGELDVEDNSGSIEINEVKGAITIDDASGGIVVTNTEGSIEVSDTSGGIYINQVSEDVYVREDGSGGLSVKNVEGGVGGRTRRLRN